MKAALYQDLIETGMFGTQSRQRLKREHYEQSNNWSHSYPNTCIFLDDLLGYMPSVRWRDVAQPSFCRLRGLSQNRN